MVCAEVRREKITRPGETRAKKKKESRMQGAFASIFPSHLSYTPTLRYHGYLNPHQGGKIDGTWRETSNQSTAW